MAPLTRNALISSRVSSDTKVRLAALAMSRGVTESTLIGQIVDSVVQQNSALTSVENRRAASDRITLRLRSGDRALADARAAQRSMKTGSYLAMVMRAHLRDAPVMPLHELDVLKSAVGHMAALGRQLDMLVRLYKLDSAHESKLDPEVCELLHDVGHLIENVRRDVSGVVYLNLRSWSAGAATADQRERDA